MKSSLPGRLSLLVSACALLALAVAVGVAAWFGPGWLGFALGGIVVVVMVSMLVHRLLRPVDATLEAVQDGIASLKDSDFSVSLSPGRAGRLGQLVDAYNELGHTLRSERQNLFQRELLLDTVIQTTPTALVLTNQRGTIVYSNTAARHLLAAGRPLNGQSFDTVLSQGPPAFREAIAAERDGLFTVELDEPQTYHLSFSRFTLNTQPHRLYLLKHLTNELSRQEVETWKKVIRVISHELNNSLAPITSLAHSGRIVAGKLDDERLDSIFGTIEERAAHLKQFIEGYGRFARLPQPRFERVDWREFVATLRQTVPFQVLGELPADSGNFDRVQMEQVLINLLKNAAESGSAEDEVTMRIDAAGGGLQITVADRGSGMSEAVLANALLPFYSTKKTGSGLGLSICREIVEAHGGRIALANRDGGGLEVRMQLPQP
ncbi:MAG: ATP-binding protein [Pseudomonadota bacterium]